MTQEILTPTEKLKALREVARVLADGLGKVVTYDDDTTAELLSEAESLAVDILKVIHDSDSDDIGHAIASRMDAASDAVPMRFEHSIDALHERRAHLTEAHRMLINQPKGMSDAAFAILQTEANHIDRQVADIDDTINNLYAVREACPSE